jgi:hypothetical protein
MTIPTNPGEPIVSGIAQPGRILITTVGIWLNAPTSYTYNWLRNGNIIPGATSQTYTPVTADVGFVLQSQVISNNSDGASLPMVSSPTAVVIAAPTIGPLTQITDDSGAVWTVSGGVVYKNGATVGFSTGVATLLYFAGGFYALNTSNAWWFFNGSSWVASADPRT